MALSFCTNWASMEHLISSPDHVGPPLHQQQHVELPGEQAPIIDGVFFYEEGEQAPILDGVFFYEEDSDDYFADRNQQLPPSTLFPSFSDPSILSLPPVDPYVASDDLDFYAYPKRARSCNDIYHPTDLVVFGESTTAAYTAPEFLPEFVFSSPAENTAAMDQLQKSTTAAEFYGGSGQNKTNVGGCSLSAQSVAARERRKRISEKTQELGRLIPGGNRMNTAEMFQAAFNYVKFLQAQVGVLGIMGSIQGLQGSSPDEGYQLQVLLASPAVQDKLAGGERCVVPKQMVEALAKDKEIKSHPSISRDLCRFVESMN